MISLNETSFHSKYGKLIDDNKSFVFFNGWVGGSRCEVHFPESFNLTKDSITLSDIDSYQLLYDNHYWPHAHYYFHYPSIEEVQKYDSKLIEFIGNDLNNQHCKLIPFAE